MKTVPLSMTRNYVSNWTVADAVREFCQNAKDCKDFDMYTTEDSLHIVSRGGTIPQEYLALGGGSKTGDSSALGGYSEGMKLAMLILARENVPLRIINGDVTWTPHFDYNADFGCETLYVDVEDAGDEAVEGVSIIVELDVDTLDEVSNNTLEMQGDYECYSTSYGEVLLQDYHKGRVYVGGLFIDNFDSDYGYNFNPEDFPLDRDRKTLKPFEVKWQIKDMISEMSEQMDEEGADRFVNNIVNRDEGLQHVYEHSLQRSSVLVTAADKVYQEKYAGKLVTSDYEEARKLERAGNSNVELVQNDKLVALITQTESYKTVVLGKVESEEVSLEDMVEAFESDYAADMSNDMYEAWEEILEKVREGV